MHTQSALTNKFKSVIFFILLLNSNFIFGEIVEEIYYLIDNKPVTKLDFAEEYSLALKNPENSFDINDRYAFMSNLIIEKLIEKKLFDNNLVVKDVDISNYINVIIEKNNLGSLENFVRVLSTSQNITYSEYYKIIRKKLAFQSYVTRLLSTPPIGSREIEEYYQKNREKEFKVDDPILNLSILIIKLPANAGFSQKIAAEKRLVDIRGEIADGLSFEEAVALYSEDAVTKNNKGNLGWVAPITLGISANSIKMLNSLNTGDISELITSSQGLAIFKVNEVIREGHIPYEVAIEQIKNLLFAKKREQAFKDSLKELVSSASLEARNPELRIEFKFDN